MKIIPTKLDGVFVLEPKKFSDRRGTFIKTFHKDTFESFGLACDFKESFYSISHKNVIRGMHFQTPPHEHAKLISVMRGRIIDVAVDLRVGSPTYGSFVATELSEDNGKMAYLDEGFAHGFISLEDDTCVSYLHTTMHSPEHDTGIRYDSFGMDWGTDSPIVSDRDIAFSPLCSFVSPFRFNA